MISGFYGKYHFLSNFYGIPVTYLGITYQNSEAAFQAQKTLDEEERKLFAFLSPGQAKRKGRKVKLREDWEEVKNQVMYEIVLAKFEQNKEIKKKLIETGKEELLEGNSWGDEYWGVNERTLKGKNHLGKILMRVREELREGE